MKRGTDKWKSFVSTQKIRMQKRLQRYQSPVEEGLDEIGTKYQLYKKEVVAPLLVRVCALDSKDYGICTKCKGDISVERLKLIPEAQFCVSCDPEEK